MIKFFPILTIAEDLSIGKILREKNYGFTGLVSDKTEALYVEFNERAEAAISSYSAPGDFSQYDYSVLVAKNQRKIQSRCLVHQFPSRILIMVNEQLS